MKDIHRPNAFVTFFLPDPRTMRPIATLIFLDHLKATFNWFLLIDTLGCKESRLGKRNRAFFSLHTSLSQLRRLKAILFRFSGRSVSDGLTQRLAVEASALFFSELMAWNSAVHTDRILAFTLQAISGWHSGVTMKVMSVDFTTILGCWVFTSSFFLFFSFPFSFFPHICIYFKFYFYIFQISFYFILC